MNKLSFIFFPTELLYFVLNYTMIIFMFIAYTLCNSMYYYYYYWFIHCALPLHSLYYPFILNSMFNAPRIFVNFLFLYHIVLFFLRTKDVTIWTDIDVCIRNQILCCLYLTNWFHFPSSFSISFFGFSCYSVEIIFFYIYKSEHIKTK